MTRRRIRSLIAFAILVAVLLSASLYLRNLLLRQVEKRIQSIVQYSSLRLRLFPPSLVIRDVRTVSAAWFFSAEEVLIQLPLASLLKSEKPLTVVISRPVIRISSGHSASAKKGKGGAGLALPFSLARGVVRDGEVDYSGEGVNVSVRGLRAVVQPQGASYVLLAEASATSFWLDATEPPLEGKLSLAVQASPQQIRVRKLNFGGKEAVIRASGGLSGAPNFAGSLQISYETEMAAVARVLKIPFDWRGRLEGSGTLNRDRGALTFKTGFSSTNLELNKIPLENANGQVEVLPNLHVNVDLNIQRKTGPESARIQYWNGAVKGNLQGFHLEPIFSYLVLPYPVRSPVWGDFRVTDRELVADFEFRDDDLAGEVEGKFPFRGPCRFTWDRKREITFQLPQLETSFGKLEVNGGLNVGRSVDVTIKGAVSDVKSAREFTALALGFPLVFPEIRGRGEASVQISGPFSSPDVKMDFKLAPAGFDKFDASAADGTVLISRKTVDGHFVLADPELTGIVDLVTGPDVLDATIKMSEGELARILPGLGLTYPFSGRASGDFQVTERGSSLRVEGSFSAPQLKFENEGFHSVSGKLTWDGDTIAFPELSFDYYGGKVKGSWQLSTLGQVMSIDMAAEGIDLHLLTASLSGTLSFNVKGHGRLGENVGSGRFKIRNVLLDPFQPADAEGDVTLRLSLDRAGLIVTGAFSPGDNDFSVNAVIPFAQDGFSVDVKGGFSNLDLLLPWKGAKGRLNYVAEVRGSPAALQVSGAIDVQGPVLPFPQFSQAVTNYSGLVIIKNNKASVRSFKGTMGGGEILGGGELVLGKGGLETIELTFQGKNLQLSPFERTLASADVLLRLIKDERRFALEGSFDVHRLLWRREVFEKFAFSSVRYPQAQRKPGFFDDLTLNIHLGASDDAWMENSLGRIRGKFDLTITGNVRDPIVLGTIDAISGQVKFQDRKFQVLRGRLSFFNPSSTEPYIDAQAETFVNDYRVTVTLSGLVTQLRPQFSSSPPLSPEDVLALLALGESFKRTYRTESSTQLSSASLVSFQLTEPAQKTAEKLFSLERIRIDPFLLGSSAEMTARLTVGKSISSNFLIYYSTNLTRQTEEIIRLEWDLSNDFSLVGTRNEFGRVSLDFKIRRRF
jgi:autotransporter translocation and assembly factor TamB